ncbi:MAG: RsmB/NOP family class I SAM-dependent RNA methyltransferase, partial [Planctomycetota bacterium]
MKEPGLPKASGFINAVLRKAVDEPDVSDKLPPRDEAKAHAELVLSHPPEVFTPMVDLLGTDDALRLCEHDNRIPPTIVRLMKDRSIDDLGDADKQPHEVPGLVVVRGAKQPDFARWSLDRIAQVQDATSFATVGHLDTRPGMTVLDRCCGVGTKTQQLAEVVGMSGKVFATDILGRRIRDLRKLAGKREDLANVTAKRLDTLAEAPDDWPESYDRILIDAPCSNSGVFPRRPEARYAQSEELLQATETTQLGLLLEAWPLLKPGGLVAYATCSIWPRENQQIVEAFRKQTPAAELVEEKAVLPSFETIDPTKYHDGGYVAVLG